MTPAVWAGALLVVAVVGLPAGLALVQRPQRGLLLLAALLPFDGLLLIVPGGIRIAAWKNALTVLVLVATVFAPAGARRTRGQRIVTVGWVPAAIALVVLGVASAAWEGGLVAEVGLRVTFFYLLVPAILWRCPFDRRDLDHLVTILMVTGLVTALVGLGQQVYGPERLNALGYQYNDAIRFTGGFLRSFSTFAQPFPFALFVMVVILVCLPVALDDTRRLRNRVFLAVTPILVVGMATAVVRSSYLGLVVGLVFLSWWRHRGLVHALIPGLVLIPLIPASVITAFASSSSLGERATGWSETAHLALNAPWGNGLGVTGSAAEKALELGADPSSVLTVAGAAYQPDNYYVKILLELGPVGLWLLLLLGTAAVVTAVRLARSGAAEVRPLAAGVAASILAAAAAAFVSTYLEIFPLDFYFWLLLGVLLCCDLPEAPSSSTPSRSVRREPASRRMSVSS